MAARFYIPNYEYLEYMESPDCPPVFVAGKELDGSLELLDITSAGQTDAASPSRIKQDDDSIDEHNTEVTGIVIGLNPKERTAQVRVEGFPVDITVFDECVKQFEVGARVMLIGDLEFCYE
ncbi:MAG: hypothetical protein IJU26_08680 [Synergistaceae bacterium]|nr:hypothetical protein [Synergistaceae bacterium]